MVMWFIAKLWSVTLAMLANLDCINKKLLSYFDFWHQTQVSFSNARKAMLDFDIAGDSLLASISPLRASVPEAPALPKSISFRVEPAPMIVTKASTILKSISTLYKPCELLARISIASEDEHSQWVRSPFPVRHSPLRMWILGEDKSQMNRLLPRNGMRVTANAHPRQEWERASTEMGMCTSSPGMQTVYAGWSVQLTLQQKCSIADYILLPCRFHHVGQDITHNRYNLFYWSSTRWLNSKPVLSEKKAFCLWNSPRQKQGLYFSYIHGIWQSLSRWCRF